MNRRAVAMVLVALGTIGSLSVLAQQSNQQPPATQAVPDNTHYDPSGYHHNGGVPYGAETSALISGHLLVARAQLQQARREVDPSARIDRVITALDELIIGFEYLERGNMPEVVGTVDHHQDHGAQVSAHNSGGCS
mgnify:FL=1